MPTTRPRPHLTRHRPRRILARLANAAVSIVRLHGRFRYLPQAHRHYAARQGDALREVVRAA